jgi:hypothetical protein
MEEEEKQPIETVGLVQVDPPELPVDPYDISFVDFNDDTYEYIRRYTTLLDPIDVKNGIIDNLLVNSDTASTSTSTGALIVKGGVGIGSSVNIAGVTTITNTTPSTNKDTGALVVEGGVGIEQNLYVGGNFTVGGTFISDSNTSIGSTEDSFDKDTGAFVVEGGVGIEKNLNVGGNVFVSGISTFVGNVDFRGGTNGNIIFGDTSDDNVIFNADVNSNIIPNITNTFDIGSTTQRWKDGYFDGTVYSTALGVTGNISISGITTSNGGFVGNAINGSTLELLRGNMAANDQFRILIGGINDAGYVEIATADNGTEPIYVRQYAFEPVTFQPFFTLVRTATLLDESGNTSFPGDITAFVSDQRLKENIKPIKNALDKVMCLSGFTYNFNSIAAELGFNTEVTYVGVSAQEVEKVLPEAVKPAAANPKYNTVQYEKIVPLLIEAIKELKKEIEQLKEKDR